MKFRKLSAVAVATALLALQSSAVSALGMQGWASVGDVVLDNGSVSVAGHENWALLGTASLGEDDFPAGAGSFNYSGSPAVVSQTVEGFLGITAGTLDPDAADFVFAAEGSAIRKGFTVSAGDTLSFSWNFLSNETGLMAQPDYAFVVIGSSVIRLADSTAAASSSTGSFADETGYHSFSYTFTSSGAVDIAFGVVDVGDASVTSALAVDSVQISPVPEPTAALLLFAGLGVMGLARRRTR